MARASSAVPAEWHLPTLRATFATESTGTHAQDGDGQPDTEFFDVKFYPYGPLDAPPVFAAVSKKHVVVCRLSRTKDKDVNPCEIIQVIRDADTGVLNCSCTWTKDPVSQEPCLAISGRDGIIKIYNIKQGKLLTTLAGHGGEINDLATSPANPSIIASASDDTTVRVWSLDPIHAKNPCVCLLGGEGHSWNLLSVAIHQTGRYVLSAGHDQAINLWTLPDIPHQHMDTPIVVHYPHFSTSEIHGGLIDCVAFYGDCILSRACHEDNIVLWRVEGFSSEDKPPPPETAPTAHDPSKLTRSAFTPQNVASGQAQYTRLLQFQTQGCTNQFFMRFSIFSAPGQHPILGFCNAGSKIYFWDFARFTSYMDYMNAVHDPNRDKNTPVPLPPWLIPKAQRNHDRKEYDPGSRKTNRTLNTLRGGDSFRDRDSDKESLASGAVGNNNTPDPEKVGAGPLSEFTKDTLEEWEKKYEVNDPHALIRPHRVESVKGGIIVGRQVAWSPQGDWCVIVGSNNRAIILHRWPDGPPPPQGVDGSVGRAPW